MLQKFWIPMILCVIVILAGCDQGKNMMKPALTPEQPTVEPSSAEDSRDSEQPMPDSEQPPVDEAPEDLSFFNPQPPEKFDITGIAGLTEWDHVLEADDSFLTDHSHLIFNDFASAVQSDIVKDYFKYSERWIANNCRTAKETQEAINVQTLVFTRRDARIEFIQKALDFEDYGEGVEMPLPEDTWWLWHSVNVYVVDETPYFELKFQVNPSHPDCRL